MADTQSKKEKEKLKARRRQEKEEREAERKANSSKGESWETMLVYVDQNGNFTNTPPDPSKRVEIDPESIQISVGKQKDEPEDLIRTGTVNFFNTSKGFGFIRDGKTKESIFVHINACLEPIGDGNLVQYETEKTPRGLQAIKVKIVR